jgi:glycine cleavage system H protein
MDIPKNLMYTKEHEWVEIQGNTAVVGITDYAQRSLVDITFVELPDLDKEVEQFERAATVESVKAVSDLYSPLSGKIIKVNQDLADNPELINQSPFDKGWVFVLEIKDSQEKQKLMDPDKYKQYLESLKE